jgi:predicted PurR-regulated permease PerM
MDKLKNNLAGIVSLIGVVGAIGAGFTTYGQLITTISVLEEKITDLESKEYVVNETVDLTDINNKINDNYESVLDRISEVQKDIGKNKNNIDVLATRTDLLDNLYEDMNLQNSNPMLR